MSSETFQTLLHHLQANHLDPLYAGINKNITDRDTFSKKAMLGAGATALGFMPSTISSTLVKEVISGGSYETPRDPDAQTASLPNLAKLPGDLTAYVFPSSDALNMGLLGTSNGNGYTNSTSSGRDAFVMPFDEFSDLNSITLDEGFTVGRDHLLLGAADMGLGTFASSKGSGYIGDMRWQTSASGRGTTNTKRAMSEITNLPSGGSSSTYGYGDVSATLSTLLNNVKLTSTVTINPAVDSDAPKMLIHIFKGTSWVGDYVLKNRATGELVKLHEVGETGPFVGIVDPDTRKFTQDWDLDTSVYEIVDSMSLTNSTGSAVSIPPKTVLTVSVALASSLSIADSGDFGEDLRDGTLSIYLPSGSGKGYADRTFNDDTVVNFPNGTDRDYEPFAVKLVLGRGSSSPNAFLVRQYMTLPQAFRYPAGTSFSSVSDTTTAPVNKNRKRYQIPRSIMSSGMTLDGDFLFVGLTLAEKPITVPDNSLMEVPGGLPDSSRWPGVASFPRAFANGHKVLGTMGFNDDSTFACDVSMANGSKIAAGSVLPKDSITKRGMKALKNTTIDANTIVNSALDLTSPVQLNALNYDSNTNTGNRLLAGSIIYATSGSDSSAFTTAIPVGFVVSQRNTLPFDVRITQNEGVTLLQGFEAENVTLGPGFVFTGAVSFASEAEFPASTTFSRNVLLPAGTSFADQSRFSFKMPLSSGTKLAVGTKTPAGVSFAPGAVIPRVLAVQHEDREAAHTNGVATAPYLTVTQGSKRYIVYPSQTVFGTGFNLPRGSVLLPTSDMGAVTVGGSAPFATSFHADAYTSGAFVSDTDKSFTFPEGSYRYVGSDISNAIAIDTFTLVSGVATESGIVVKGGFDLPYDIAVPLQDNLDIFSHVAFANAFVLKKDWTADREYIVEGDQSVSWAENHEIPFPMVLSSDFSVPTQFVSTRKVTLGSAYEMHDDILSVEGAFIKLPGTQTVFRKKISVTGASGFPISMGADGARSYIGLQKGTRVLMDYVEAGITKHGYRVKVQTVLPSNYKLDEDIVASPAFVVAGLHLPSGSVLPGAMSVGSDNPFPEGLTLTEPVQLAEDYIVESDTNVPYTLRSGATLASNSNLSYGSSFAGSTLLENISYSDVEYWEDEESDPTFFFNQDTQLPSGLKYWYFSDLSQFRTKLDLTSTIENIENVLALLQRSSNQ